MPYDINSAEANEKARREAVNMATEVISTSPVGTIDSGRAFVKTIKKHPVAGSAITFGLITMAIATFQLIISTTVAVLAPAPISDRAPLPDRVGNMAGRFTNAAFNASRGGIAPLLVDYHESVGGGVPASSSSSPTSMPGLVQVSTFSSSTTSAPSRSISPEAQQAIDQFVKGK